MRNSFIIALLLAGVSSQAFVCNDDSSCFSAALRLLKQGAKVSGCIDEMDTVARAIEWEANATIESDADALEFCILTKKQAEKRAKKQAARIAKINKAISKK
jgi:hypothetical protein